MFANWRLADWLETVRRVRSVSYCSCLSVNLHCVPVYWIARSRRPLLSVDISTCLSVCLFFATLMLNTWKLSDLWVRVQYGAYRKMPMARRLVTSSMTLLGSMTSCSWRHNIQRSRIRKLGPRSTISVDSFSTYTIVEYRVNPSRLTGGGGAKITPISV